MSNAIVLENELQGTPITQTGLMGTQSATIDGFASSLSDNVGTTVNFCVNENTANYTINIYRLGYYNGDGCRLVDSFQHQGAVTVQPSPLTDTTTGLVDCSNWSVTDSWNIPGTATSGVYMAQIVDANGQTNEMPFVVTANSSTSDILFQTSDETWQAYNPFGGESLYQGTNSWAKAVSYERPIDLNTPAANGLYGPWDFVWGEEFPAIQYLEQNGYDVTYQTGRDTSVNDPSLLQNHKVFLSVGHDEYWTAQQVANVTAARDAGVNLEFWSGDEATWETRFDVGADGTPNATLVCYKQSYPNYPADPSGAWTGLFGDPAGAPLSGQLANALSGTAFAVNQGTPLSNIQVPYADSQLVFWTNTAVANLQPGQTYTLGSNLLGYEWDVDLLNASRPAGLVDLSSTTETVPYLLQGTDVTYAAGSATHNLTIYRAASGALVFSAGTVNWSWGLNAQHTYGPVGGNGTPADVNVQQAMVNLFEMMGVDPQSLSASLTLSQLPIDTTGASAQITSLTSGISVGAGTVMTINGTATDAGGGLVAEVEVSTDGGTTWQVATGRDDWSYTWYVPTTYGTAQVLTRAVNDSLYTGQTSDPISVSIVDPTTVGAGGTTPVSTLTNLQNGDSIGAGTVYTLQGTAVDIGGGWIGGVEVSTDGGTTWNMATGTTNWTYSWTVPDTVGSYIVEYRAGDNNLNLENANAITVNAVDPTKLTTPVSAVTNFVSGDDVGTGASVTVNGSALDLGGGWIGGVQISTDGGNSWVLVGAPGASTWTYTFTAPMAGSQYTILYQAGDNNNNLEDPNALTLNVVDPSTLSVGGTTPQSTIANLTTAQQIAAGTTLTITGTAQDLGGGWIGGVEVSTDGGNTWSLADGTTNWSFNWNVPTTTGAYTISVRAGDNNLNLEAPQSVLVSVVDPSVLNLIAAGVQPGLGGLIPVDSETPSSAPQSYMVGHSNQLQLPVSTIGPTTVVVPGEQVLLTGTSADVGGGNILGVQISTDAGANWQLANGTQNWNYAWQAPSDGQSHTIETRAIISTQSASFVDSSEISRTVHSYTIGEAGNGSTEPIWKTQIFG